jgi:hypothetical protein
MRLRGRSRRLNMKRSTGKGSRGSRGLGAFKYIDPLNNHVVWPGREEALRLFIQQRFGGIQHKIRNAHSSNSEDALTWSCFDTLAHVSAASRRQALTDIWELSFGDQGIPPGVLNGAIHVGKRYGNGESTEVDASIEGIDALVFIEAKLYSPMSAADPEKQKPHNQIERKLRVGLNEAAHRGSTFYFILLDVAPMVTIRSLKAGASLSEATKPKETGFLGKWTTAYWFARYKYGSRGSLAPLQRLLADAGFPEARAKDVSKRMGWLTWGDLFKSVLRSALHSYPSDAVAES